MLSIILKNIAIIICTTMINKNFLGLSYILKKSIYSIAFIFVMLTPFLCLIDVDNQYLLYYLLIMILWITTSHYTSQPQTCFIATMLAFTMSYSMHALGSFIISLFLYVFFKDLSLIPYEIFAIISLILQISITILILRIKRFRNGMPFLHNKPILNIATIICLFLVATSINLRANHSTPLLQLIGICTVVLTFSCLIFWWQAQITKSYRRKLELRDQESKRIAALEREILLQKVLKENERLARISHRDNTLITTLKNATVNYLYTEYADPEEARIAREELIANIEALSEGRADTPENYTQKQARDFDTKSTMMNKLLHQMDLDALKMNITFSVHFGVMLEEFVPSTISEMDLVHIVDDLLKNAFKATKNSEPRMVQLQFYKLGKHLVVEVSDNGIPFEVRSLVNMGIEKRTTYEDGSGIGLMDIWSTKEKYRATYHLDEYATAAPFSKKISLTFDKKNRYSIRTWRKDEILKMSRRADLQVYDHVD